MNNLSSNSISTPYIWTNNLEFDGAVGNSMDSQTVGIGEMLNLAARNISLPANGTNGNMFVRHYWAPKDNGGNGRYRDDLALFAEGHWYRLITEDYWYGNPVTQRGTANTADSQVSTPVKIECSGQGMLSKGQAAILFDETFATSVDKDKPVLVLVTPTSANCKGIAVVRKAVGEEIDGKTVSGFLALELNGGKSNSTFDWQAIGTTKVEGQQAEE